ncbi:sensor histidine kinase [Adhaeribacter pallidiroseus]|uniref:Histidine kinase n=1 Tax=Adhaeribacter pallidiroseus TaxID=2072847 RepID=A0A369QQ65_9BACT|nr:histidine kinase [Adhaeribacter pallidiroseus]RDC64338.1 Histidine kinase [Adhaeribacter pallidiroseus]
MFRSKAFTLFTHALCWLLFFSLPLLFLNQRSETEQFTAIIQTLAYWLFYGCYIGLFYLHGYVLLPRFFLQKKYFAYAGLLLLLFTAVYFLRPFDNLISHVSRIAPAKPVTGPFSDKRPVPPLNQPPPPPFHNPDRPNPPRNGAPVRLDIVSIFLFIMIVTLSMAVEITQQWRTTQQRALLAETDKAKAELSFLKAQINPHFLFNILNNIYSLAITQNENTAEAILKLSNLMRYLTDEVTADFVDLKAEVACMQDYIALQQLRLSKKVKVNFTVTGNLAEKKIAPLVLIPFIENVFKYGVSNREESNIAISLRAEEQTITFYCQNPIFLHQTNRERTGIGLANTRERLQHLYPDNYQLTITSENQLFTVSLILPV